MTERLILLRVGIDSGSGGIQSPMFDDGGFELLPIPDGLGVEGRTYGNLTGRHGRPLVDYFPVAQRSKRARDGVHFDPEFEGFTYGDPGTNKRGLLKLGPGDLLVFYAGLQQWAPETGFVAGTEVLGIVGYFEVAEATLAGQLGDDELANRFATNAHVRHPSVLADQRDRLILVRGGSGSRLLERAVPISEIGADRNGTPIKVLSRSMREVFSDFDGRVAIQRSMPRTVPDSHTSIAADFVRTIGTTEQQPGPPTSARAVPESLDDHRRSHHEESATPQ